MRIKKFKISNYKAISDEIEIDLGKNSLIPIIGVNECGKTTILNSIFAFDYMNDDYNSRIRHLTDVHNLYETSVKPAKITATIEISQSEIKEYYCEMMNEVENDGDEVEGKRKFNYNFSKSYIHKEEINISRILEDSNKYYEIEEKHILKDKDYENEFCETIIRNLPYILYFDDFKDSFPDKLEIIQSSKDSWLSIVNALFTKTNKNYSVFKLGNLDDRRRKGVLADVEKVLNDTLTKDWISFKLTDNEAYKIRIEYAKETTDKPAPQSIKQYLIFEIVETLKDRRERTFFVRDRSKGFYWFFNFVMKLEFNPKVSGTENNSIYLLDEPGSYLHPYAQNKLCKKLYDLSKNNKVIYCTHTHYLLDPDIIPLNTINISDKSSNGEISLSKCNNYPRHKEGIQSAFQPIYDALNLKPYNLDFSIKKFIIVEGIYDFYSLSLFNKNTNWGILPGKNANSLINLISLSLGLGIEFRVLWDNDKEGNDYKKDAEKYFGENLSRKCFFAIPLMQGKSKMICQDLFFGEDFKLIKSLLKINDNSSFEKTISTLYFSKSKTEILKKISVNTKNNFMAVFESLNLSD